MFEDQNYIHNADAAAPEPFITEKPEPKAEVANEDYIHHAESGAPAREWADVPVAGEAPEQPMYDGGGNGE